MYVYIKSTQNQQRAGKVGQHKYIQAKSTEGW